MFERRRREIPAFNVHAGPVTNDPRELVLKRQFLDGRLITLMSDGMKTFEME